MPQGQVCGHCEQPRHNVRTCKAYKKYMEKCAELEGIRQQLEKAIGDLNEARAAIQEDRNIIKFLTGRRRELENRIVELEDEIARLKSKFAMATYGD